jgi:hypothetical protein
VRQLVALAAAATHAAEVQKIKKVAKGHKEVEVYGHVSFKGDTCKSRGPVEIDLDEAPKGGTACTRQGKVRLNYIWSGKNNQHCLGKRISGVFVIYVPYASFTGNDVLRYTVKIPAGLTRTYEAEIRIETGQAPSETTSSPSEPQEAGAHAGVSGTGLLACRPSVLWPIMRGAPPSTISFLGTALRTSHSCQYRKAI